MANDLHRLLLRQIGRANADPSTPPSAPEWARLLEDIDQTYASNDHDRYLLERSLELTSEEMQELYARLADERDRLHRELEIARVLQTSILPTADMDSIVDIAAQMLPATEVGGDYYDIVSTSDATWIGIGDVAGHGLRSAIIMVMLQSIATAMIRATPSIAPSLVLSTINRALWDNIRRRLRADEHVTCTFLRFDADGKVTFSGAHEDILVLRASGPVERIETPGAWLAARPDVEGMNTDGQLVLWRGDTVVLFTDGITEAMSAEREQFGLDRLTSIIEAHRGAPVSTMRDAILTEVQRWMAQQDDDLTVVVLRYR
jgi:sigma-B regulation protein RsbU (phosphoserine phosphatase)